MCTTQWGYLQEIIWLCYHIAGSRGLGDTVAQHYTKIAMEVCKLSKGAQHMVWLDLNTAEGEYWMSMNLAGDYSKACHDRIHINVSKASLFYPHARH